MTGGVGSISPSGVFTAATAAGIGTVTATAGGKTGTAIVTIVPAAAAEVAVDLASGTLQADSLTTIAGTVRDAYGNVVLAGVVQWSVTGGTIVRLTPDGRLVLYRAPISTTLPTQRITATTAGVTTSVTVTISAGPPVGIVIDAPATAVASGGTIDFDAIVTDQFGNRVTGATIAWKTSGGTINQDGVLTAPSQPGIVIVTASTAGRESSILIEVTTGALDQFSRQATSATSLIFLVVAIIAIAAGVFMFVRYRASQRELEEMRRGGQGGGGGGGSGGMG